MVFFESLHEFKTDWYLQTWLGGILRKNQPHLLDPMLHHLSTKINFLKNISKTLRSN